MAYLDWTKEKVTYILSTLKNKITDMLVNKKDIIEITQAEYDALPDTKLTDGKVYAIKDGKGGGGGGELPNNVVYFESEGSVENPIPRDADTLGGHEPSYYAKASDVSENKYSTEETIIGTWIDGKPLYRKVSNITASISQNQWGTLLEVSGLNIESLVKITAYKDMISIRNGHFTLENNQIKMYTPNASSFVRVVIEYTKTTD